MKTTRFYFSVMLLSLFGNNFSLLAERIPGIQGEGTISEPYLINSVNLQSGLSTPLQKLNKIANWVNHTGNWNGSWGSTGKYFRLDADISNFTNTIGTLDYPFYGCFDGNGYRIEVSIYKPSSQMVGLFGQANHAIIRNLTVSGSVRGGWDVGGVLGWGVNTTISHCTNLANVEVRDANNALQGYCGGIAGSTYGGLTIEDCVNAGRITGAWNVGGINGFGHDRTIILRCVNLGTVTGSWQWIGGIVGCAPGTVEHCFNGGYVCSNSNYVGGIVGLSETNATIRYCLNTGVVHSTASNSGSIVGYISNATMVTNNFYDKQMSIIGGISRNDIAGKATGRMTIDMVANSLQNVMGMNLIYWTYSPGYHYPKLENAGNILYVNGTGGRHDYDCNNEHWYHVASSVLKLQSTAYPTETTSNMWFPMFVTTYLPNGNDLDWTDNIGLPYNYRDSIHIISMPYPNEYWWNARWYQGNAMLTAKCGGFKKEVPIYFPLAIQKSANFAESLYGSFSIGEVTPNIVTDNATIAIQTATEGNLNVSIYDLAGTKVENVTDRYIDANTSLQVDLNNLSNLSTGSYMAVVSVGNEVVMRKFIKQ